MAPWTLLETGSHDCKDMPVLRLITDRADQVVAAFNPGVLEVCTQLGFEVRHQIAGPVQLGFQRTSCFGDDLLAPPGLV